MAKERLDNLLVQKNLFASREKARAEIMAGNVFVDGNREDKPGTGIDILAKIELKAPSCPYVSRGGLKLKKGLEVFGISPQGKKAMDVGASSGGFTDCLLKHGAKEVIAVDVGYGQLAWELREDERVHVLERTNIRNLLRKDIPYLPELITVDVSFISLKKVLPAILALCDEKAEFVCLLKPQFEAGREKVGKKGVVRERKTHEEVLQGVVDFFIQSEVSILGLTYSPIKGPEGNIEFIIHGKKPLEATAEPFDKQEIKRLVDEAHEFL